MRHTPFNTAIARVLEPVGFVPLKGRREWRRYVGDFLDDVNVQVYLFANEVTVNYAIRHDTVSKLVDKVAGPGRSGGFYPITGRIGQFISPYDLWWKRDDPEAPANAAELVRAHLLPFFDRMHEVEPYIEKVAERSGRERWGLVTPRLELAVLLHGRGETDRARKLLDNPPAKLPEGEHARVAAVRKMLFGDEA